MDADCLGTRDVCLESSLMMYGCRLSRDSGCMSREQSHDVWMPIESRDSGCLEIKKKELLDGLVVMV
jgi:hypothetical protein